MQPAQVTEGEPVDEGDPAGIGVDLGHPHRSIEVLRLTKGRLGPAVGPDQAVGHEVVVVRLVAEVAAVGPARRAVGQLLDQAVVPPLPDETALQPGCGLDGVPVLPERAVAVAHGVRVLAHDQRPVQAARPGELDDGADGSGYMGQTKSVTRAAGAPVEADGALVVQRPGRLMAAHPGRGSVVVGAVARFVAQRPGEDGGVVAVAQHHARDARDPLREVARVVAERRLEGVRLDVRLVDDVEAQLIGQIEQRRVVGVVRGPHGVEAVALDGHQVGAHGLARDDATGVRVEVMTVDAADEDALAVDEQVAAREPRRCGSRRGWWRGRRPTPSGSRRVTSRP